jgi:hypothetical protein
MRENGGNAPSRKSVAVVAVSYMVGPAVLSLLREDMQPRIGLLLGIGGYFEFENVLAFGTTGHYRQDGEWVRGDAGPYAKWVIAMTVAPPASRNEGINASISDGQKPGETTSRAIDRISALIGEDSDAVSKLLEGREASRTAERFDRIPAEIVCRFLSNARYRPWI